MLEAGLTDSALTPASASMLIAIADEPGLTVADISRRILKTQQAISQHVAQLENLGLLERRLGPRRGVGLHVTDIGRAAVRQAIAGEEEVSAQLRTLLG